MLFHTTYSDYFKENVHLFDPLDFLAELTQHIPPARVQLIRRYGLYSSRIKGHWTRMPYVLQRAPSGWTSHNDDAAATASNRAGSGVGSPTLEVPATETDAPDARERRHAWARLLARVYEVDPLVCPRCGARLVDCRRQAVISSDPESRANQKDPEPSGESRSSATGTRSDHPELNRLLSAEWNHSSDRAGGSTLGKVRSPAPAARRSRRRLHRASSSPLRPPSPRHSCHTRLRRPSRPRPPPTPRPRTDQSRPRRSSRCSTLVRRSITQPIISRMRRTPSSISRTMSVPKNAPGTDKRRNRATTVMRVATPRPILA